MTTGDRIMHEMLRRKFGSAVGRPCAAPGCRRLADGWGLVGDATHYGEKGRDGKIVRGSTDPSDYAPLCFSHNAQLDRGGDWQHCRAVTTGSRGAPTRTAAVMDAIASGCASTSAVAAPIPSIGRARTPATVSVEHVDSPQTTAQRARRCLAAASSTTPATRPR